MPAPGIVGGEDGETGEVRIDGELVDPKSLHAVGNGDQVLLRTPGGGNGKESERDSGLKELDEVRGII